MDNARSVVPPGDVTLARSWAGSWSPSRAIRAAIAATGAKLAHIDVFWRDIAPTEPANAEDPGNHALNRRVEISVYPPEAQ